jgi:hypothetical protein
MDVRLVPKIGHCESAWQGPAASDGERQPDQTACPEVDIRRPTSATCLECRRRRAPYSVRRREKAPVSMPLEWGEVKPTLIPSDFNMRNLAEWAKRADPWAEFFENRQSLRDAVRALKKL